jgi:hypothetical protein
MADTAKESGSGKAFYGDKTSNYLKKVSRESVEKHTNTSVLFFAVDYERSKRNFYGELIIRVWTNPIGIEVKGVIQLDEGTDVVVEDIPNKIIQLNFSCYIAHLRELGIDPQIGDYFSTKNRIYMIHNKTILDANETAIMTDREALYIKYDCVQADDEQLVPPGSYDGAPLGTKNEITGQQQYDTGTPQSPKQ